jgi:phosphonate transport system permease protein
VTLQIDAVRAPTRTTTPPKRRVTGRKVATRRLVGLLLVAVPIAWSWQRAVPAGTDIVNRGGLPLVADLLTSALHPQLSAGFLAVVLDAAVVTLTFAALGTAGALAIGLAGGLLLSDAAWHRQPPPVVRLLRLLARGVLVAARSIHELVWALLFVSVL